MRAESVTSRWWALLLLLPAGLLVAAALTGRGDGAGLADVVRLAVSGDPCRWELATSTVRADGSAAACGASAVEVPAPASARTAIVLVGLASLLVGLVGRRVLGAGHRWWAPLRRSPDRGGRWIWGSMPVIAAVAGALGVVRAVIMLVTLDEPTTASTAVVAMLAWWEATALVVSAIGVLGLVVGPISASVVRPVMQRLLGDAPIPLTAHRVPCPHGVDADGSCRPDPDARHDDGPGDASGNGDGEVLGITASGGGIRSAAVMIGILRGLAETGTFQRARWLHVVSGGGFAAGGWQASTRAINRGLAPDEEPTVDLFAPDHPWFRSVRARLRYLDNGVGSILVGAVGVVGRMVLVFGSVVVTAMLGGWLAGRLVRSWAVVPDFSNDPGGTGFDQLLVGRLVLPGLVPAAAAVVVLVAGFATSRRDVRRRIRSAALVLGAVGAALLLLLVAIPIGIWAGRPLISLFRNGSAETNVTIFGVVTTTGLAGAVWRMLRSRLAQRWSRLGGVFLLAGLFALAGKVADDSANLDRTFRGIWVPIVAVVWLVVTDLVPSHHLTLNGVYRRRLAGTFVLGPDTVDEGADRDRLLAPLGDAEPTWSADAGSAGPELVLCGTAQSSALQHGGLPALGFAFSTQGVALYDETLGQPDAPWEPGSAWEGYPRRWTVSRSMALAGAAFSSAMGRQSFGTTNSLLAAVNLRLGIWVPNPNRRTWFREDAPPPRVHLGYFAKELFGRYDPDDDAFVYVTDGGHRDNLGLVEQLRERPDTMIVLDASGDTPGGFGTLRQAIELADVELDAQIDLAWEAVEPRSHDVPRDCVTTGTATFRDGSGHVTSIVYAKAQISDTASGSLRRFAASDPSFPDYSTADQYLTEEQFDRLVELGEHLAERIATVTT